MVHILIVIGWVFRFGLCIDWTIILVYLSSHSLHRLSINIFNVFLLLIEMLSFGFIFPTVWYCVILFTGWVLQLRQIIQSFFIPFKYWIVIYNTLINLIGKSASDNAHSRTPLANIIQTSAALPVASIVYITGHIAHAFA